MQLVTTPCPILKILVTGISAPSLQKIDLMRTLGPVELTHCNFPFLRTIKVVSATLCLSHCQFPSLECLALFNPKLNFFGPFQFGPMHLPSLQLSGIVNLGVPQHVLLHFPEDVDVSHRDYQILLSLLHFVKETLQSLFLFGFEERDFDWPYDWEFPRLTYICTNIEPHQLCKSLLPGCPSLLELDLKWCKKIKQFSYDMIHGLPPKLESLNICGVRHETFDPILEAIASCDCLLNLLEKNKFILDIGETSCKVAEAQSEDDMQRKVCYALTKNRMSKKLLHPVSLRFWPVVLKDAMKVFRIKSNEFKITAGFKEVAPPKDWDGIVSQEDTMCLLLRQKALTEIPVFIRGGPERPTQAPVYRTKAGRAVKPTWKLKEARSKHN
jgi:hypothetical protein